MRRVLAVVLSAILFGSFTMFPAQTDAQVPVYVTRVYSETARNGCLTYVSQWSDGSYQEVPWICSYAVVPLRSDKPVPIIRSYTERGREGCTWFVALWADGVYTGVPWACPYGAVPLKPGTVPPAPYFAPRPAPYWQPYPGW